MQLARNLAVGMAGSKHPCKTCIAPGWCVLIFARCTWENPETLRVSCLKLISVADELVNQMRLLGRNYLASAAGSFTTGQTIVVDGGGTKAS